jgi:hypothetical protein
VSNDRFNRTASFESILLAGSGRCDLACQGRSIQFGISLDQGEIDHDDGALAWSAFDGGNGPQQSGTLPNALEAEAFFVHLGRVEPAAPISNDEA